MPRQVLRVVIVDDEPLARQRIEDLLRHEPDVETVGTADSGTIAVDLIRSRSPDLVFLDVQMPGMTGLEVVKAIGPSSMPATIFVTAFDQYALRAFEVAAVDYLVKPFDDERFEQAFHRARRVVELEQVGRLRQQLIDLLAPAGGATDVTSTSAAAPDGKASKDYLERIAVEMKGKVKVVPVGQVPYITASGPYAELHTAERTYLIRESMQDLEARLDPHDFLRVHRSVIVRLDMVETMFRGAGGDYEVQLKGGTRLPVSRSRREELERRLGVSS